MAILQLYKIRLPNCVAGKYIFLNGKEAAFIGGRYATAVPTEIEQLDKEIEMDHPHIYRDAEEMTMDSDVKDPLAVLRDKFFKEFQEQQAKTSNRVDKGNTETAGVTVKLGGIATSANTVGTAAASNSPAAK